MRKKILLVLISFCLIISPLYAGGNRWTSKPPVGSQIDWSHPLSKGLVGCWLMNEGGGNKVINLVDSKLGELTNGAAFRSRTKGIGINLDNTNDYVNLGTGFSTIFTFSVVTQFTIGDITADHSPLSKFDGLFGVGKWVLHFDDVSGLSSRTDLFNFVVMTKDPATGWVWAETNSSVGVANTVFQIAGTYIASPRTIKIYVNGQDATTNTNLGTGFSVGNSTTVATCGYTSQNSKPLNGIIYFAYIYNRILSPSEVKQLYQEPYCFIKPPTIWSMFSTVIAAARRIWAF